MLLSEKLKDRINYVPGSIGIYVHEIQTNESAFVGNCEVFPSLGIAKLVLLIEVFRQIEEGTLHLSDVYVLNKQPPFTMPENEYEETVGILDFLHDGIQLTVEDLVYSMCIISDNTAFNILLSMVGIDHVNATMRQLGMEHIRIGSMLFEWKDEEAEKENFHSVREIGDLLVRIYKGQLISKEASAKMLNILKCHQRRGSFSFLFSRNISVAQQTGFDRDALHLCAIVMAERPFVLCAGAMHVDMKLAENMLQDVAHICYHSSNG